MTEKQCQYFPSQTIKKAVSNQNSNFLMIFSYLYIPPSCGLKLRAKDSFLLPAYGVFPLLETTMSSIVNCDTKKGKK